MLKTASCGFLPTIQGKKRVNFETDLKPAVDLKSCNKEQANIRLTKSGAMYKNASSTAVRMPSEYDQLMARSPYLHRVIPARVIGRQRILL